MDGLGSDRSGTYRCTPARNDISVLQPERLL